jgi:predicted DNA-binding protein (MmcQ/YjbR family)
MPMLQIDHIRDYCLSKKETTETFPFDEDTLVFKVMGKIFVFCPLNKWEQGQPSINLKCDPNYALELRARYDSISGGFHSNKKHWNTVALNQGDMSNTFVLQLIDHSYEMVVKNMTKKLRDQLNKNS